MTTWSRAKAMFCIPDGGTNGKATIDEGPMRSCVDYRRGLPEGEHQSVSPIEEGRTVDHVDDFGVIETHAAQLFNMLLTKGAGRRGKRNRGADNRVPALPEIGAHALVEQPLNVIAALGVDGSETRMHGRAIDASIVAGRCCGREFALRPRQAVRDVVEDVLVGL